MYKHVREDLEVSDMINAMLEIREHQDDPRVGIFWYDLEAAVIFSTYEALAEDIKPHKLDSGVRIKTTKVPAEQIWKYHQRKKHIKFQCDYTQVPSGRVFQIDDDFVVITGDWIDEYPQVKQMILQEFDLPQDTRFQKDEHWDIGHGGPRMQL